MWKGFDAETLDDGTISWQTVGEAFLLNSRWAALICAAGATALALWR